MKVQSNVAFAWHFAKNFVLMLFGFRFFACMHAHMDVCNCSIYWSSKCQIKPFRFSLQFLFHCWDFLMFYFFVLSDNLLVAYCNCNCNYILFTKLPSPGDSEMTFRSSSQAATCQSVYHTRWRLHTVPLIAERQAGKLWIPIFILFGLTRPGMEPVSTVSVADALSTRPLIGRVF